MKWRGNSFTPWIGMYGWHIVVLIPLQTSVRQISLTRQVTSSTRLLCKATETAFNHHWYFGGFILELCLIDLSYQIWKRSCAGLWLSVRWQGCKERQVTQILYVSGNWTEITQLKTTECPRSCRNSVVRANQMREIKCVNNFVVALVYWLLSLNVDAIL